VVYYRIEQQEETMNHRIGLSICALAAAFGAGATR
jgi:hypothetical protein